MEFEAMSQFFSFLNSSAMKRKYPMIGVYNSYLRTISTEESKNAEIELFKNFLISNQSIPSKELNLLLFKTGKKSFTLNMINFTSISEFWEKLTEIEQTLFPEGKPTELPKTSGLAGVMAVLEKNPLLADIVNHVKSLDITPDHKITGEDGSFDPMKIMNQPEFQQIVSSLQKNIQSGKYNVKDIAKDLTGAVTSIVNIVQNDLVDDDSQEDLSKCKKTLEVVTDTMKAVERNEQVDINNLMKIVSDLKLN
jgi:hypothetical protein